MTQIFVRRAGQMDCRAMAELLNEIIAVGGTTAYTTAFTSAAMQAKLQTPGSIWHVAEDATGRLLGFQWLEPNSDLPAGSLDINSFVKVGSSGLGVGSTLFEHTRQAAHKAGAVMLHAIIRADNTGGLAYYQSRGFEDFRRLPDQILDDGTRVDKIWKRYDLR